MVAKKRKSKRVTLQQKYKIIKRTKEHKKRLKKGILNHVRKTKSVEGGIPASWPYKEELLQEVQRAKQKMEDMKQKQKQKRQEILMEKRQMGKIELKLNEPAAAAAWKEAPTASDPSGGDDGERIQGLGQNSRRAYLRELRRVVDNADVILHVLDARDPLGTRSTAIEELVLSNYRKKLVFILNKADLVPRPILMDWLTYLRRTHPVIPFKSNTQTQRSNLSRAKGKMSTEEDVSLHTNQAVGTEELIGLLKNYARSGDGKTSINVGIVGYPNVGKSSLINSLMRSRVVGVSPNPGFTKSMQEVVLDKNIRLLDSPGIVFADGDSTATALRNCVSVEEMEDVYTPIQAILEKCPSAYLMQVYGIPRFRDGDFMGFLALVARGTGKLKKGGIPNVDAAARSVIHDWNDGKIKYYCVPPAVTAERASLRADEASVEAEARVLDSFSRELNIDDLARGVISALESHKRGVDEDEYVPMDTVGGSFRDLTTEEEAGGARVQAPVSATGSSVKTKVSKTKKGEQKAETTGVIAQPYDFGEDFQYSKKS